MILLVLAPGKTHFDMILLREMNQKVLVHEDVQASAQALSGQCLSLLRNQRIWQRWLNCDNGDTRKDSLNLP